MCQDSTHPGAAMAFSLLSVPSSFSVSGPGEALLFPEAEMKSVLVNTPHPHPGPCLLGLIAALALNSLASEFFPQFVEVRRLRELL